MNPSMVVLEMILLGFLIVCAIVATVQKNLLSCVLIFMSYSLVMSVIWALLESPDLAITEAAVGAVDHVHMRHGHRVLVRAEALVDHLQPLAQSGHRVAVALEHGLVAGHGDIEILHSNEYDPHYWD